MTYNIIITIIMYYSVYKVDYRERIAPKRLTLLYPMMWLINY